VTIKPMLAMPMHKGKINDWSDWAIEEKYDGHRLIIYVNQDYDVQAYTRPRNRAGFPSKEMAERVLPEHLRAELGTLPTGVYDGELLGGGTSTDVTRLDLQSSLRVVLFDVPSHAGTYDERRKALAKALGEPQASRRYVTMTDSIRLSKQSDVEQIVKHVWARGGEGAILKRRASSYQPGKRSADWIKVKKCQHATLTVVGFEASRGTVRHPGHPFAVVRLRDDRGRETTVKTKDDHELRRFEEEWNKPWNGPRGVAGARPITSHPAIGRRLVIEYQDMTRDGDYRHPRWDRWEEE
jgi:ATP-dependent DNA ligase